MSDTLHEVVDDDSSRYGGDWPRAGLLVVLALWPLALLANGAALKALWYWFLVPEFDAPPIRMTTAVGLICISFLFSRSSPTGGQTFRQDLVRLLLTGFVYPFIATLTGFVVHYIGG